MKRAFIFLMLILIILFSIRVFSFTGYATSQGLNVSIQIIGVPTVNIIYPTNTTYTRQITELNYTISGSDLQACWYTLNSGQTNTSIICGENVTGITISEGSNTWAVYANNSDGIGGNSVTFVVTISEDGGLSGGGGSRGSSGASSIAPTLRNFKVSPGELNIVLTSGSTGNYEIEIENLEKINLTFDLEVSGLSQHLFLNKTKVAISANEKLKIPLIISAPESGIYVGRIIIRSGITEKEIFVILNVRSKDALFDVSLTLSKAHKILGIGKNLKTFISLLQVGEAEQVDVIATYLIKDFKGVVLFIETETLSVYKSKSFVKEFPTFNLPEGDYIAGIDVQYPGGFATSSERFSIAEQKINIWAVAFILLSLFALIAIFFAIKKYREMSKKFLAKGKK